MSALPIEDGSLQHMSMVRGALAAGCVIALLSLATASDASRQAPDASRANQGSIPSTRGNELCSARNAVGVGLRGDYFAEPQWRGTPALSRIDASIDFDASMEWPAHRAAPRSVRWQGWIKAPLSGVYRFHLDGVPARLLVARHEMLSADRGTPAPIELQAGRYYPITIEIALLDPHRQAPLRLEWTAPHGARYVVPRSLLFMPTETAIASEKMSVERSLLPRRAPAGG
jgi:hypothetical protein